MTTLYEYCKAHGKEHLLEEWSYSLNGALNPKNISFSSNKKVWWKCCECGKEWIASIDNRSRKTGCPVCSRKAISKKRSQPKGNSLSEKCPDIAKEWLTERNGELTPDSVTYKSHQRAWFRCGECGFEWETRIENRVNFGCPKCKNVKTSIRNARPKPGQSLKDLFPSVADEWDFEKNEQLPEEVCPSSEKAVWWKCGICGHSYKRVISVRTNEHAICPKCSSKGTSYGEQFLYWAIKHFFAHAKNRCKYWGMEYDIVVDDPQVHFMIEYGGANWHKGKGKQDAYKREVSKKKRF